MKNRKKLSIFLLCIGGVFGILGTQFGIVYSAISSVSLIIWGLILLNERRKTCIFLK